MPEMRGGHPSSPPPGAAVFDYAGLDRRLAMMSLSARFFAAEIPVHLGAANRANIVRCVRQWVEDTR